MKRSFLFAFIYLASLFEMARPAAFAQTSFLNKIEDVKTFRSLARTYQRGKLPGLPHVLFAIERSSSKIFYADSNAFDFHGSFARAVGLSKDYGNSFFVNNYTRHDRPLLLGTLVYNPSKREYFFEFSDADVLTIKLVEETVKALKDTFFAPVIFHANSMAQEEICLEHHKSKPNDTASLSCVLAGHLTAINRPQVHFAGTATGILKIAAPEEALSLPRNAIVIFEKNPISMTPARGVMTQEPGSPLSHLHMLARTWRIPDVTFPGAAKRWGHLSGQVVTLLGSTNATIELRTATKAEVLRYEASLKTEAPSLKVEISGDGETMQTPTLHSLRRSDSKICGAKAAQLGEISHISSIKVPPGRCLSFGFYREHFEKSGAKDLVLKELTQSAAVAPDRRNEILARVRGLIESHPIDNRVKHFLQELAEKEFPDKGIFVRSSTNAEDLANFNGAGIYTTVPNVRGVAALGDAVKKVWASVWSIEAFDARSQAAIQHDQVLAGVLLQVGVNAKSAGVLITRNPFNLRDKDAVYINAKKGLGIRVVNGEKVPEQIIFNPKRGNIKIISHSSEDSALTFNEGGGVVERPLPTVAGDAALASSTGKVLTTEQVKELAKAALAIEKAFGGITMDIEWVVDDAGVQIVQGRPYPESD